MHFSHISIVTLICIVAAQDVPPDLGSAISGNQNLSTLGSIIRSIPGLSDALGQLSNITILAPNNAAFAALGDSVPSDPAVIAALLNYHVINGTIASQNITDTPAFPHTALTDPAYTNVTDGQVVEVRTVEGTATVFSGDEANATVTQADIAFSGGLIHIIDSVLTVPVNASAAAIASGNPSLSSGLSSFDDALFSTDLVSTVRNLADVTVFAPSNGAFEAISSALSGLNNESLSSVLEYHVVQGTVGYSSLLTDDLSLPTLQGGSITVNLLEDGSVFVNGAEVILADVLVPNGVVHIIDNVLNPSAADTTPSPTATAGSPAFSGASSASEAPTPTSTGAAAPIMTNAVGMAALVGGAVAALMI